MMDERSGMMPVVEWQDLSRSTTPEGFRGRPAWFVQLWWVIQSTLFGCSPQICYGWRRFLLRRFGAQVGKGVLIRPTARITYPWKVSIGAYSWIGDEAVVYSLDYVRIGKNAVISQRSYICSATHKYESVAFELNGQPVIVEDEAWVATDVFVAPGVTIGRGAVVGARSSVFNDLPPGMICFGSPAKPVRPRPQSIDPRGF